MPRAGLLTPIILVAILVPSCHLRTFRFTDPKHQVTVAYPGNVLLLDDPTIFEDPSGAPSGVSAPNNETQLLFTLQTEAFSTLTAVVYQVPGRADFSPKTYYEATTARELASLGVEVVEPVTDVVIGGKTFQRVGYLIQDGTESLRSRLYEYYDPASRRALVISPTVQSALWKPEIELLEPLIQGIKFDWQSSKAR